jgi:beta-hydroxylase
MLYETLSDRKRRIVKDVGSKLLWSLERSIVRHSLVGDAALLDRTLFPWLPILEAAAPSIRSEVDALLVHRELLPNLQDISKDQQSITTDDRWKAYFLYAFGLRSEANAVRCPLTSALLRRVPGLVTAFFSVLAPGKHIPKHRGVYRGLVRIHLGLKVPKVRPEECRMVIDDRHRLTWEEGRAFVFDDCYQHEVWNDTDEERVVLLLDVLRPLPAPLQMVNRMLVRAVRASPFVTDAAKNEAEWERRFAEALARPARA